MLQPELKALSKRKVFNLDLKIAREEAILIKVGRSFQSLGAIIEQAWALLPRLEDKQESLVRRPEGSAYIVLRDINKSQIYDGAIPFSDL